MEQVSHVHSNEAPESASNGAEWDLQYKLEFNQFENLDVLILTIDKISPGT